MCDIISQDKTFSEVILFVLANENQRILNEISPAFVIYFGAGLLLKTLESF